MVKVTRPTRKNLGILLYSVRWIHYRKGSDPTSCSSPTLSRSRKSRPQRTCWVRIFERMQTALPLKLEFNIRNHSNTRPKNPLQDSPMSGSPSLYRRNLLSLLGPWRLRPSQHCIIADDGVFIVDCCEPANSNDSLSDSDSERLSTPTFPLTHTEEAWQRVSETRPTINYGQKQSPRNLSKFTSLRGRFTFWRRVEISGCSLH